jgi:hypothetical protein
VSAPTAQRPVRLAIPRWTASRFAAASPWIALVFLMVVSVVVLMRAGRDTSFYLDDWPALFARQAWTADTLLRPHIDHLQLFPFLLLKGLWDTVGLHDYWVYRAVLAGLDVLTGTLLFLYGRRRIGPWPSLALAACLVLMAPSWFNLLYAFQVNFVGAMAAGVGALLLLDRRDRPGDGLAAGLLVVAVGSNGVGVPFIAAVGIELLLRRDWRRLWVAAVPTVLYGLWRLEYGQYATTHPTLETAWRAAQEFPRWVFDALDDTAAAAVGFPVEYGGAVVLALIAIVGYGATRTGGVTPRFLALLALPLMYWFLTALGRINEITTQPDENRFLYPGGVFLALLAMEAARTVPWTRQATVVCTAVLLFGAARSANEVEGAGAAFRGVSLPGKHVATAYDLAGDLVPPDFSIPEPDTYLITAGRYREMVRHFGSSPGYTREELLRADEDRRQGVDRALVRVHRMKVVPVPADRAAGDVAPRVRAELEGAARPGGRGCVRFTPRTPDRSSVTVEMPVTGLTIRAGREPVAVRVHRFALYAPAEPVGTAEAGTAASIEPAGADRAPEPFLANLGSPAPFSVCA